MSVELLAPVGNFECLKAAVQNGADAVYLGASEFNARNSATNFSMDELGEAIKYAKLRNVNVYLTLNILIKEDEFESAVNLANEAYKLGIDAIIVQDLGLANEIIKLVPNLHVHASTQTTVYDSTGAQMMKDIGFKRVVLARELSVDEIAKINKEVDIEVETFVHGALCVSYSGQCLFSSMVGGRSGNRGKCAQPCRLPYKLINKQGKSVKEGYLLSPRDLSSLEYLPQLIKANVKSFKVEGRLKNPEYVATVTRIYRKYIDLAISGRQYIIDEQDKIDLMQVFNRGGFSSGYFSGKANKDLVFSDKSNNMGIFLGVIKKFNPNKGYIDIKLESNISIGDRVAIGEDTYNISELLLGNNNIKNAINGQGVTLGRIKGDIKLGTKVYKISSKELQENVKKSYELENKRIKINVNLKVEKAKPVRFEIIGGEGTYENINMIVPNNIIPENAINTPISKERIIEQLSKTKNTPYDFEFCNINIDSDIYISKISELNELRRKAISLIEEHAIGNIRKKGEDLIQIPEKVDDIKVKDIKPEVSVLLNILNIEFNYKNLKNVDSLYIPYKYFKNNNYSGVITSLCQDFKVYLYMPAIIKKYNIEDIISKYGIYGIVVSNIGQLDAAKKFNKKIIGNYTLNIYNNHTTEFLKKQGVERFAVSPELDKTAINKLLKNVQNAEIIVYGNIPVMNSNYCVLGNSNMCYGACEKNCENEFYLQDRLGMKFRVLSENSIMTIYNTKTLSINYKEFIVSTIRVDILNETVQEINEIVEKQLKGERLEGKEYTNGNLNREI